MVSTTGQQEHNENAEQLGGTNFDASKKACVSAFDVACDVDAYEAARMSHQRAENVTIEEQGRMVRMGTLDPSQVTSNRHFAAVAQKRGDNAKAESKAKASADALFLAMIDHIRDVEAFLADKYGESFATDLMEELHQAGKITDEERDYINSITDINEQRQAIGILIDEKLRNGEMTMDDLRNSEYGEQFAQLYAGKYEEIGKLVKLSKEGKVDFEDLDPITQNAIKLQMMRNGEDPSTLEGDKITRDTEVVTTSITDEKVIESGFDF